MPENKDNLDLDLNFLDAKPDDGGREEDDSQRKKPAKKRKVKEAPRQYNWKLIAVIAAVIIGLFAISRNTDSSSKISVSRPSSAPIIEKQRTPAVNDDSVLVGSFRCSRSASSQADRLRPGSLTALNTEQTAMNARWENLRNFRNRIDALNPSPYSPQSTIDQFNKLVDQYNLDLNTLRGDSSRLETRIDQFNSQVVIYNNYLATNCTKATR